jgi:hypothetical protein|nr:MAG TPA: Protein of unknown function (DUF2612) [Caudoviricetes sp.]
MSTFYQESSLQLIENQLRESPNYIEVIRLLAEDFDEASDIYDYIAKNINVLNARGVWLDLIGDIVGVSRVFEKEIQPVFFGFDDQPNTTGFGQARFRELDDKTTASSVLNDDDYRVVIIGKIARNYGDVSEVGVATSVLNMTQADNVLVYQSGPATFSVYVIGLISDNIKSILTGTDLIPRAAGVKMNLFFSGDDNIFGFADQLGIKGFDVGHFIN